MVVHDARARARTHDGWIRQTVGATDSTRRLVLRHDVCLGRSRATRLKRFHERLYV